MNVIAADIGGTKTLLVIAEVQKNKVKTLFEHKYASKDYPTFELMLEDFLKNAYTLNLPLPIRACFAVAGPIISTGSAQQATVTNLPWKLDSSVIASRFGISSVVLINDFQAVGVGVDLLQSHDLCVLQEVTPLPNAPRVILGAGTGLGIAQMIWEGSYYKVIASEGGHADFAPTDILQTEFLQYLWKRYDHISYDRTLSGPGLINIYSFLAEKNGCQQKLHEVLASADPAATISTSISQDPLAYQALETFIKIYGAQAGNLALFNLPYGGVYIAGGIAPKIVDQLQSGGFMKAFLGKGRMSKLLTHFPVAVVLNPKIGLMGAILSASRLHP